MAVLAIQTAARCKLCQHHRRADIDALLERRSRRIKADDGQVVNLAYVLKTFGEWGVVNPTAENVTNHVKKHLEFVDSDVQAQAEAAAIVKVAALRAAGQETDVEGKLKWIIEVGIGEVEERIARGEKSGVTLDHVMKAAAELQRRAHNESQHRLLGELAGGLALAMGGGQKALDAGEVVQDADFEDVEA